MDFSPISKVWCDLNKDSRIFIISDIKKVDIAEKIKNDNLGLVRIIRIFKLGIDEYESQIKSLNENDLLIVLLTIDSFITQSYRDIFPPFSKPNGVECKYTFIRLDIPESELLRGLNTDIDKVESIISNTELLTKDTKVRVTSPSGTNIISAIKSKWVLPYRIKAYGGNVFLPPAEVENTLYEDSSNGTIVVDVTVGELRINGEPIDSLGIVDMPVSIEIKNGKVKNISGGDIAQRLKCGLNVLDEDDLVLVELGRGLSDIIETGIIGVDESMNGTCHFGIGRGNPLHIDVVVRNPKYEILEDF